MPTSFSDAKAQVQAFLDEAVGVYEREPQQNMKGQRLATVQLLRKILGILNEVREIQTQTYSNFPKADGSTSTVTVTTTPNVSVSNITVGQSPVIEHVEPPKRGPGRPRKTSSLNPT